jgi:hypothetical protein
MIDKKSPKGSQGERDTEGRLDETIPLERDWIVKVVWATSDNIRYQSRGLLFNILVARNDPK